MKVRLRDRSGIRLYRYVAEDVDRHGNVRIYFRRKGQRKIRLTEVPGASETPQLQTCQIVRDTRTASSFFLPRGKIDQDARATNIGWRSVAPISARSKLNAWLSAATTEGLLFRRSGCGLPSRPANGVKSKPAPARYRVGYADLIALTVQRWTGRAGFDGAALALAQAAARRHLARIAAGVRIACLKQSSGHASLTAVEEG